MQNLKEIVIEYRERKLKLTNKFMWFSQTKQ